MRVREALSLSDCKIFTPEKGFNKSKPKSDIVATKQTKQKNKRPLSEYFTPLTERGKLDFDHNFMFLTIFLKRYNFLLDAIFFGSPRGSFTKKVV